jgi:hypothetical protein
MLMAEQCSPQILINSSSLYTLYKMAGYSFLSLFPSSARKDLVRLKMEWKSLALQV